MEDPSALVDQFTAYLIDKYRDTIMNAYFAGQSIRVFMKDDEVCVEAVDLFPDGSEAVHQ